MAKGKITPSFQMSSAADSFICGKGLIHIKQNNLGYFNIIFMFIEISRTFQGPEKISKIQVPF